LLTVSVKSSLIKKGAKERKKHNIRELKKIKIKFRTESTKLATSPEQKKIKAKNQKHTTAGIRWWSPTQLLICRSEAYVWQSGRDAQFSSVCGRM
jgi:hypothetical protein